MRHPAKLTVICRLNVTLDEEAGVTYDALITTRQRMSKTDATLASEMRRELLAQYGPLLGGSALHQALGFSSAASMRQAALRNQVGVRLFSINNRRGKFALTADVARWLAQCAESMSDTAERGRQADQTQTMTPPAAGAAMAPIATANCG